MKPLVRKWPAICIKGSSSPCRVKNKPRHIAAGCPVVGRSQRPQTCDQRFEHWHHTTSKFSEFQSVLCFNLQFSSWFAPCSSLAEASALPTWPGIWCSYRTCQHFPCICRLASRIQRTIGPLDYRISIEIGPMRCFADAMGKAKSTVKKKEFQQQVVQKLQFLYQPHGFSSSLLLLDTVCRIA